MRQIVLDTETTGLNPEEGHRIIEIGCVELLNRRLTDNRFHVYLNPERAVDAGAVEVHGLDNHFLADKPRFADIVQDFINYIEGAELIIHNAPFDVGFLNAELRLLGLGHKLSDFCEVLDTLAQAKKKHPGQRNSLDALCKRYGIDNTHRDFHGALLDAEILAEVYLAMTGGQFVLELVPDTQEATLRLKHSFASSKTHLNRPSLTVIRCNEVELEAHQKRLSSLSEASKKYCNW